MTRNIQSAVYRVLLPGAFFLLRLSIINAQTIVPTQADVIIIDNGTSGKADPNDRIRYKVTIQNTGGADGTGAQLNIVPDLRTTLVPGSFMSSPLAVADIYACTGNVGLNVSTAVGVKANDFDDDLAGATLSVSTPPTNGSVMLNNDGSFTYMPNAGFTGSDVFTYTIMDVTPLSPPAPTTDMATVTITVSNMIWFVSNILGGSGGTGTRSDPFRTLADFNASSGPLAGHIVHIQYSGMDYPGGMILKDNMRVIGTGHTGGVTLADVLPFVVAPNSWVLPAIAGSRPVITNAGGDGVALAQNNNLRGFDVGNCSDFGMDNIGTNSIGNFVLNEINISNGTGGGFDASHGSGASTSAVFDAISSSGGVNGVNLTNCAGTFTINGGMISNPTGTGALISGGSIAVTCAAAITANTGFAVDIDNHDSGNATFSGNITSTATGIRVQNCGGGTKTFSGSSKSLNTGANAGVTLSGNTGATISFTTGGLVIATTSGTGFNATGGATAVNVTGTGNTIASITGTALNVVNTTIGASNLNFQSISANGAPNGIVLNGTGGLGGLVVTGIGTTNGSGGTIQNITNRGVSASGTINLSLKNMAFNNANTTDVAPVTTNAQDNSLCNAAIYLNTVTNAILDNVDINGTAQQGINIKEVNGFQLLNSILINCGAGGQAEEDGLYALNLFGTCAITNSSLTFPSERAAVIYNTNKTLTLNISGSTFGDNQLAALGADGFEFSGFGTSNTTLNITNSTFIRCKTNGLQVITEGNAITSANVSGSTISADVLPGACIDFVTKDNGSLKFNILNNPLLKANNINVVNVFGFSGMIEGRINGNTITSGAGSGSGVRVIASTFMGVPTNAKVEINSNNISNIAQDFGIEAVANGGTGRLDATITGNTISILSTAARCIQLQSGGSGSAFSNITCGNVANNTTTAAVGAIGTFQARCDAALHTLLLQGSGATVAANWDANTNSPLSSVMGTIISQSGTGIFMFGATCNLPTNP